MQSVTKVVTILAVSVGVIFFTLAKLLTNISWIEGFIFALGMVVAFVPEGLEPTVTLALAMATQRMAKRHALMKKLSAVETLGCTNVICTDKTGTLTQNEMTVQKLWVPSLHDGKLRGREISFSGVGYEPVGETTENGVPVSVPADAALLQVLLTQAKCNTARLTPPDASADESKRRWNIIGDPRKVR